MKIIMRRVFMNFYPENHGNDNAKGVVSRVMRKIDSGIWQKSITGGGLTAPWLLVSRLGAKGQGRRNAARLALDPLRPGCYQPTRVSCSMASRCFMFMYFLLPHWVPAT